MEAKQMEAKHMSLFVIGHNKPIAYSMRTHSPDTTTPDTECLAAKYFVETDIFPTMRR